MAESDLRERATIKFQIPLKARDLEAALIGLVDSSNCSVSYTSSRRIDYDPRGAREDLQKSGGTISAVDPGLGFISLNFDLTTDYFDITIKSNSGGELGERDESFYTSLQFFIAPGYSEQDIQPGELAFMDKAKDYFYSRFGWITSV